MLAVYVVAIVALVERDRLRLWGERVRLAAAARRRVRHEEAWTVWEAIQIVEGH